MVSMRERLVFRKERWVRPKNRWAFFILAAMFAAYASFLTADIFTAMFTKNYLNPWSMSVKYACILMCFALTLMIGKDGHGALDRRLLQLALALTCVADALIGFLDLFVWGIAVFALVQIAFIGRHSRQFQWNRKEVIGALCVYVPIATALVVVSPVLSKAGLLVPGILYTLVLATSVWMAVGTLWRGFYRGTIPWLIAVGMVSFFFCDLNVGLSSALQEQAQLNFVQYLDIARDGALTQSQLAMRHTLLQELKQVLPLWILNTVGILVWYFYLPAQALLVASGYRIDFLRSILPVLPDLREGPAPA